MTTDPNPNYGMYLLQDGTHADPAACKEGKDGVLRHSNGLAVCLDADGKPQTIGSDAIANMNVAAAKSGEQATAEQPKPEPKPGEQAAAEKQAEADRARTTHDAPPPAPVTAPLAPRKP